MMRQARSVSLFQFQAQQQWAMIIIGFEDPV